LSVDVVEKEQNRKYYSMNDGRKRTVSKEGEGRLRLFFDVNKY